LELVTLISSALAEMLAVSIMTDVNMAASILLGVIGVMALLYNCNCETLLRGNGCQHSTSSVKARAMASKPMAGKRRTSG
jgi:hypothetical protein